MLLQILDDLALMNLDLVDMSNTTTLLGRIDHTLTAFGNHPLTLDTLLVLTLPHFSRRQTTIKRVGVCSFSLPRGYQGQTRVCGQSNKVPSSCEGGQSHTRKTARSGEKD